MGSGLIQLLAIGQQDIYLKLNPSLTFFKKVFKTHSNFSVETISVEMNRTDVLVNDNTTFKIKIPRHGDLMAQIYFTIDLPDIISDNVISFRWIKNLGEALIDNYYITIGGNLIDKQYGQFMHVMNELSLSETKKKLYGKLIGNTTDLNNPETYALEKQNLPISTLRYRVGRTYPIGNPGFPNYKFFQPSIPTRRLYIPLYFWFNRDYGNALPLVSLQYSDVELTIVTRPITELYQLYYSKNGTQDYWAPDPTNSQHNLFNFVRNDRVTYMSTHTVLDTKAHLEINYVYLDNLERSYFAYKPVEYLITQTTQINLSDMQNTNIYNLTLQNPVTEFIWFIQRSDVALRNDWFNYTDPNYVSIMKQAKIMFNGIDRMDLKEANYFNYLQPWQHTTANSVPGLYLYSFSLFPEEYQPSGSFNASRINNIQLYLTANTPVDQDVKKGITYQGVLYVINYNFLKIASGIGGPVFAS